jgi:carbon-monoxide dehydrogenase medium subunit
LTPFSYATPSTLEAALAALTPGARIIAGGQSLLLALKERQVRPTSLVAIGGLPGMDGLLEGPGGTLQVGAATRYASLAKAELPGWQASLAAVAGNLADRAVRNMGTIGGGLCQADPRFDMPAYCTAVDAAFTLASPRGERVLRANAFFNPAGGTRLATDEILRHVTLPPLASWQAVAFEKFAFRAFEAAIVNMAGAVALDAAGKITRLRIAVGGATPVPALAVLSANARAGQGLSQVDPIELARDVSEEVLPIANATSRRRKYQSELIISLAQRLLRKLQTGAMA